MSPHENVELVPEEELHELFAPRRPERAAFRAGIEERIAARRTGGAEDTGEEPAHASFWRRAAALFPIDPLGGALAGPSLAKAFGGKFLPAALALPVVMLLTAFGGFLAGARSLRRASEGALPLDRRARGSAWTHGSRANRAMGVGGPLTTLVQFGAMSAFLVTWLFGGSLAIDVLTLALVVSMLALVVTVRNFARLGLLARPDVTRLAVGILMAVFGGCFLWFHNLRIADEASNLGVGWATSAVFVGAVACLLAGGQPVRATVALLLGLTFTVVLNTPGVTRTSHESLRSQLAGLRLSTGDLGNWREAAALHMALRAAGVESPDLSHVRERVALAMRSEADVHPVVWTSAHLMGLVEDADWRALSERPAEAHSLDQLQQYGNRSATTYYQYLVPMLLAARELTPQERERATRSVVEDWPEAGQHGALDRALACVHMLDALERPDLVEELRGSARALLSAHWISGSGGGPFSKPGGFSPNPEKFATSIVGDTLSGIELMARFGVPEDVDRYLMRSYLRRECVSIPLFFESLPYLKSEARASLLRLREELGMPARTWLETVLAERLFIATVLIVLLCLVAIRLAPPLVDAAEPAGAQP